MSNECTVAKFFSAVATGEIQRVKALRYSRKHFTTQIRVSPPQLPVPVDHGNVFHLVADLGNTEMLRFLWEELQLHEKTSPLSVITAGDNLKTTPIMLAADSNHSSTVALFLDFGVPIDERIFASTYGYTTLFYAVMRQKTGPARTLLERNANPNIVIGKYGTALHKAVEIFLEDPQTSHDMIDLLLNHGANPFVYPDQKVKIATIRKTVKNNKCETLVKWTEPDGEEEIIKYQLMMMKENISTFLTRKRCVVIEEEVGMSFCANSPVVTGVHVYTKPNAYELALSQKQNDLANKLALYGYAHLAALRVMRYARYFLHVSEGNLRILAKPLITIILLQTSQAFGCLTSAQVQSIIAFASNKNTLGTRKISFLQNCIFSFFQHRLPAQEEFNLSQYTIPKSSSFPSKHKK